VQELSMNILDIAENSVRARATLVQICLEQITAEDLQTLTVTDNGDGMDAATAARVTDPFTTTRTTRKVGLGLPFLQMAARQTGGDLTIESAPGEGATVIATFGLSHIDLMPLGDIGGTVAALAQAGQAVDFTFRFSRDGRAFSFDTREIRRILDGVPLGEPAVAVFIREHVAEGVNEVLHPAQTKE
jgi:signal transduction histidine kinase